MPVTQTEKETPSGVSFFVVFQIDRYTERWVSLSNPRIVELQTANCKLQTANCPLNTNPYPLI